MGDSEALENQHCLERQPRWTESIAVGGQGFLKDIKEKLGGRAIWRKIIGKDESYELREHATAYEDDFALENEDLRTQNTFYWDISI